MKESQIIGLIAGILLAAGYIALHLKDEYGRAKKAKAGQLQIPFSPLAIIGRLALVVVVALAVLKFTLADKFWFAGTFALIYTIFFAWEIKKQWSKKQ